MLWMVQRTAQRKQNPCCKRSQTFKIFFIEDFHEQISETVKVHKQSKELLASTVFKGVNDVNWYNTSPNPRKTKTKFVKFYHLSKWNYRHQGKYNYSQRNLSQ